MHLMTTLFGSGTLEAVEGQKLPTEYALQMYASHGELRFGGDLHFERAVPAGVVVGRKMYLELQSGESVLISLSELQQGDIVGRAEIHEGLLPILYPGMRLH
tara:strand:- start:50 stop:355 length:306 start_codon:yes stop_codon:yes gene_type:complete